MDTSRTTTRVPIAGPQLAVHLGGALCVLAFITMFAVEALYSYTLPSMPDLAAGRIDSLRVMRYTVYGTPGEANLHYWVQSLWLWPFIVGLAILIAGKQRLQGTSAR